jgi:hypothetical protein
VTSGPANNLPPGWPLVHHSVLFPVQRTRCGLTPTPGVSSKLPASDKWPVVTCLDCLRTGAAGGTWEAKRRLASVEADVKRAGASDDR